MSLSTSYDNINNLSLHVETNVPILQSDGTTKFQAIVVTARCNAVTTEGGLRPVSRSLDVGVLNATPRTLQQLYTTINGVNSGLGTLLKNLILDAINVDASA